jgi:alkylation response protein AidB-like acyl-CoA dehydrogenase
MEKKKMEIELTPQQVQKQEAFQAFVDKEIVPYADQYDKEESVPPEIIKKIAEIGYLGAIIPTEHGGKAMDAITFGLLCEEIGRGSASLLSLLTVHSMVCQAILKWGTASQKTAWLPKLATGETIGAFGLTEPNIGSDAKSVETTAVLSNNSYILNGEKKWISFGQVANLFLIFTQCDGKPAAFLVERNSPGFSTEPITGLLGFRSAMLAQVHLNECHIPAENMVGKVGFGFSHVAGTALDQGRYCVGWGCVGLAYACLTACLNYTSERKQFGAYLKGHQLIQQMIADMITNIKAARLLCYHAAYLKEAGEPSLIMETSIAKYFASKMVTKVADDAVQIHGANGCSSEYPVQRYLRDAKIMEIIEGSTQMQQIIIAKYGYHNFVKDKRAAKKGDVKT